MDEGPKVRSGSVPEEADFFIKTTLVKAAFLCAVLSQDPSKHHLAFKIGIFGLEVPRQPAKSKALEVNDNTVHWTIWERPTSLYPLFFILTLFKHWTISPNNYKYKKKRKIYIVFFQLSMQIIIIDYLHLKVTD